ncbi:MAG: GGDEF domain-containing protein [Spirochaetaceae bacterium]|nr:GGDEF domain-containing protein [Spirochaetaceae bacterium]
MNEAERVLKHIHALLHRKRLPTGAAGLAEIPLFPAVHAELVEIRKTLHALAAWDLTGETAAEGVVSASLESLKGNLRGVIACLRRVGEGDLAPQGYAMGEFSVAFNGMVRQLEAAFRELRHKEENLRLAAAKLYNDLEERNFAVEALQQSESRFRYLANHDALTGILNRRSFMERAAFELRAAIAQRVNCALAMMDIDHFKRFNDQYGHLAGDEALRHTAQVMSSGLRKMDFLGRYGGEEFVFFFHGADIRMGHAISERVRKHLAASPLKLESGPVFLTASFGVTMITPDECTPSGGEPDASIDAAGIIHRLVDEADQALYQAKRGGRNQVISFCKNGAGRSARAGTAGEAEQA